MMREVTVADLSRNRFVHCDNILGLEGFKHLTTLDLSWNGLTGGSRTSANHNSSQFPARRSSPPLLLPELPLSLLHLNLSHNQLTNVIGIAQLPQLRTLQASHNLIKSLPAASIIPQTLEFLDVSHNNIYSLKELRAMGSARKAEVEKGGERMDVPFQHDGRGIAERNIGGLITLVVNNNMIQDPVEDVADVLKALRRQGLRFLAIGDNPFLQLHHETHGENGRQSNVLLTPQQFLHRYNMSPGHNNGSCTITCLDEDITETRKQRLPSRNRDKNADEELGNRNGKHRVQKSEPASNRSLHSQFDSISTKAALRRQAAALTRKLEETNMKIRNERTRVSRMIAQHQQLQRLSIQQTEEIANLEAEERMLQTQVEQLQRELGLDNKRNHRSSQPAQKNPHQKVV